MTHDGIKANLSYLNTNKIPYDVVMDNGHIYSSGRDGHLMVWCLDKDIAYSIRSNVAQNQAELPIEINMIEVEHIVSIRAFVKEVKAATDILDSLGRTDAKADVVSYIEKQDYVTRLNITESTGDGVHWRAPVGRRSASLVSNIAPPIYFKEGEEEKTEEPVTPPTQEGGDDPKEPDPTTPTNPDDGKEGDGTDPNPTTPTTPGDGGGDRTDNS